MELNINRIFSDRVVWDDASPEHLRVTNSLWDWVLRIISWVFSPATYTEENQKTIECFRNYLLDRLGAERLQRICSRYSINFDEMGNEGNPLLSRHVAQIVTGAKDVTLQELEAVAPKPFEELTPQEVDELYKGLASKLNPLWSVPGIKEKFSGAATELFGRLFFDPFLSDRERQEATKNYPDKKWGVFVHSLSIKIIKRDMGIGTVIQAPNHPETKAPRFYYLAGKVITAKGMVSYIFHPVSKNIGLEPIRIFRGTAARSGEIDSLSSVITDLERDLGRSSFESGEVYEPKIKEILGQAPIEIGHSLGSAQVQYRLAHHDHIQKAYLFSGPGIALRDIETFNKKTNKIKLIIRRAKRDSYVYLGEAHLGWKGMETTHIHYRSYGTPKNYRHSTHTTIPHEYTPYVGHTGYTGHAHEVPEHFLNDFCNQGCGKETFRRNLGPPVASLLGAVRYVVRGVFGSRAEEQRGFHYLQRRMGRLVVDRFSPIQ